MRALFVAAWLILLSPLALAQPLGPEELVKQITADVMAAVKSDKALASGDRQKALRLAEEKILPHVDFEEATRLAVGRAWRQATPEQRKRLVDEFRAMLVRTYSSALQGYQGQEMRVLPSRTSPDEDEATVRNQFIPASGRPVPIEYQMRKTGTGWKIYDITVEGISLVLTYRSEFDQVVKQEGIDGLIRRLSQKNAPPKLG